MRENLLEVGEHAYPRSHSHILESAYVCMSLRVSISCVYVLHVHLWLALPTTRCIPTHVFMWGTSLSASMGVHVQI